MSDYNINVLQMYFNSVNIASIRRFFMINLFAK